MSRRYPRFVVEDGKCTLKLFDVDAGDAGEDVAECEITPNTAFALVLSLMSFIEGKMRKNHL